jgi:hypothetical protein
VDGRGCGSILVIVICYLFGAWGLGFGVCYHFLIVRLGIGHLFFIELIVNWSFFT